MVRVSTIGVRDGNLWTLCRVTKRSVIAVFDSELSSLRNLTIEASELASGARCIAAT